MTFLAGLLTAIAAIYLLLGWMTARNLIGRVRSPADLLAYAYVTVIWPVVRV